MNQPMMEEFENEGHVKAYEVKDLLTLQLYVVMEQTCTNYTHIVSWRSTN